MIMEIAIAKDGFIDANENPNFSTQDNFLQCLRKIFNFQNIDLMEFDGNTCQMINSYDPTNSIFIYTNQQGTFLYTITSATPRTHKNDMVWDCVCYKMEDVANINEILSAESVTPIIYKKLFAEIDDYKHQNVEIKQNFRTQHMEFTKISDTFCVKLKFLTNPTTDDTLETKEDDGSYNFFFPLRFLSGGQPSLNDPFPIYKGYYKFYYNNVAYTLDEIIKNNASNLKSAELLPFFPCEDDIMGGSVTFSIEPINELTISSITGAKVTSAGIFFPYGHSTKRSTTTKINLQTPINTELLNGGGVKGFYSTPLGNFNIDYNGYQQAQVDNSGHASGEHNVYAYLDSEGWFIDGMFGCRIAPHYINFYTNETGQLLIQNMTTNAQELREIERNYQNQKTQMGLSRTSSLLGGLIGNVFGGNIGGIFGNIGQTALGTYTDLTKIQVDYDKAIKSYNDKIETQELLASMTGKSINGNISISNAIPNLSINNFILVLECNYSYCEIQLTGSTDKKVCYIPQKDYDYSINMINEKTITNIDTSPYVPVLFAKLLSNYGNVGTNYNLVFKFVSVPSRNPQIETEIKQTQILNFAIRNKIKVLQK